MGAEIHNKIQQNEAQAAVVKFLQFAETTNDPIELKQRRVSAIEN